MTANSVTNAPFRCDIVGSFLRPDVLKQARADFNAGIIDAAQLKTVEDVSIRDLGRQAEGCGPEGCDRWRISSQLLASRLLWGLQGIERRTSREGYMFHDEETTADIRRWVTARFLAENHPFVEHFKFVAALAGDDHVARRPIPAPIQTFSEVTLDRCDGQQESLRSVYATDEELADGDCCRISPGDCRFVCCWLPQHPVRRLHMGHLLRHRFRCRKRACRPSISKR